MTEQQIDFAKEPTLEEKVDALQEQYWPLFLQTSAITKFLIAKNIFTEEELFQEIIKINEETFALTEKMIKEYEAKKAEGEEVSA